MRKKIELFENIIVTAAILLILLSCAFKILKFNAQAVVLLDIFFSLVLILTFTYLLQLVLCLSKYGLWFFVKSGEEKLVPTWFTGYQGWRLTLVYRIILAALSGKFAGLFLSFLEAPAETSRFIEKLTFFLISTLLIFFPSMVRLFYYREVDRNTHVSDVVAVVVLIVVMAILFICTR